MPQEEIPGCGSVQRARAGGKTRGNCYLSFCCLACCCCWLLLLLTKPGAVVGNLFVVLAVAVVVVVEQGKYKQVSFVTKPGASGFLLKSVTIRAS